MRLGLIRKLAQIILPAAIVILFCGFVDPAFAIASSEKGTVASAERRKTLDRFFHLAGIDQTARHMDSELFGYHFSQSGLPPEQFTMLQNIMDRVFEPDAWLKSIQNRMSANYQPHHMNSLLKWYRSPLGGKVVRSEIKDLTEGWTREKEEFIQLLKIYPPEENRLELAERLEQTLGLTDYTVDSVMMFVRTLIPFNDQFKGQSPRTISQNIREDIYDPMREQILQSLLYKFRHLSDAELSKFVGFATSESGKWFFKSYFRGSKDAMRQTTDKLDRLLDKIVQEMEAGGGESELLKEIAPPGQRYLFVRQRDPFVPLVDPKEGFIQTADKDETEMEFHKFSDDLKKLPLIPLEVYRSIKNADPKLYTQLEYFGGFFKQETKLASMSEGDYIDAVSKYKDLLEKANEAKPGMIETPIQASYDSLKLVGVIWKNKEIAALIETGDKKGHSVNEGDLFGPNFGVVESINQNKISILEQSRDYKGNILSQKKVIKLIQESPEEG